MLAAAGAALLGSPIDVHARTADPADALAWLELALRAQLRGDASWGATIRARVDAGAVLRDPALPALPPRVRAVLATLAGEPPPPNVPVGSSMLAAPPLLAAAALALAGAGPADVRAALGATATGDGELLLAIVEPSVPAAAALDASADLRAAAVARYVRARVPDAPSDLTTVGLAVAYRRDPMSAERVGRDAVAAARDDAAAHAAVAAAFEALGDPARTRAAWQAAVDASREPAYLAGLAEAAARANDPDAALIFATSAAAASGDPAVTWTAVARALVGAGALQQGLAAARSAIDLAGPDALPAALDVAIAASRALGRDDQARDLAGKRARLAPAVDAVAPNADDPTDAGAATAELARAPGAPALARLWVATRWNPRDVAARIALARALPAGDPRLRAVQLELVALAGDPDPARGLAAVQALR